MAKFYDKYLNNLTEKHLSDKELTKREQIAKAIARENPGMDMSKKMAIATAQAKKIAEQTSEHVHVIYANGKPITKYVKEQDALKDADILRKKRDGTKIEIKKEIREDVEHVQEGGLWDNIHAKRNRIESGSGEHMRRPGEKGRPTASDLKASQNEEVEQIDELSRGLLTKYTKKAEEDIDKSRRAISASAKRKGVSDEEEYDSPGAEGMRRRQFNRYRGVDTADTKLGPRNEEVEQIDEVSHETRQSWVSQTWKKHLRHTDDKPGVQKPEMPEARKKIFNVAMDKAGKESSARYDKQQQEKRLARTPVVHDLTHMSHGEVYDHTQTSSKIHDGDVLKVKGGVAAMVGAWPAMVHGSSKVLHSFNPDSSIHKIDNGSYHQTAKLADKIHGIKEEVEQIDEISKKLATSFFHGKQDQARKRFMERGQATSKKGIMLAKDKIEGRAKVPVTDYVDESIEELNALLNQKGIEESYKSDDAFNLLKKKGAKNVRTTSSAIVYSHKGRDYTLRHADTGSGHRTVREDELKRHLQRLEATGDLKESFAPGKLKERLLDRYTPSITAEDDSE